MTVMRSLPRMSGIGITNIRGTKLAKLPKEFKSSSVAEA
jgi:hypothetical protein